MNNADLITMLGNLSRSLQSVEHLIGGFSYLAGIILIYTGILKFKKLASSGGHGQDRHSTALAFILVGAALLFLPTTLNMLSNSTFGGNNVLQYTHFNQNDVYASMGVLIQTAGLIWFVRGCIMVLHAGRPGESDGVRGFLFIFAGVMAINFSLTLSAVAYIIEHLVSWPFSFWKV